MSTPVPPPDVLLTRAPEALHETLDGETVLLLADRAEALVLDPVASAVWAQTEQPLLLSLLCARLAERFDVPIERVATDLDGPLQTLIAAGALVARVEG